MKLYPRLIGAFTIGTLLLSSSSCTLLFYNQKIQFHGGDPEAYYTVDGTAVDSLEKFTQVKRRAYVLTGSKYGYLNKSKVVVPKKFDPVFLISAAMLFPLLYEFQGATLPKKHSKEVTPLPLDSITPFDVKGVYIGTGRELDKLELASPELVYYSKYKRYLKKNEGPFTEDRSKIANFKSPKYNLSGPVDGYLEIAKCKEVYPDLITPYDRYINLSVEVKRTERIAIMRDGVERYNFDLRWFIRDRFNNILDSVDVFGESEWTKGYYYYSYTNNIDYYIVETAFQNAAHKLIHHPKFIDVVQNLRKNLDNQWQSQPTLELNKSKDVANNLESALAAQVTIKIGKYNGSGSLVSPDGHILTAYKVIQDSDDIDVLLMDGSKHKGTVLRTDPLSNLALIKIDTTGLRSLRPAEKGTLKTGMEIFAIGTPADVMLSQTLTRGIVSGSRLENDIPFIQTDARLSYGDNGCPLVTSNGQLIGVVNEKLIDHGVEGLSFAVPIEEALNRLKIELK